MSDQRAKTFYRENYLFTQLTYMQIVGMFPIDYTKCLPQRLAFLSVILNRMYFGFWQLICIHIAVIQIASVHVNWGKSLDDISPFLNTSLIYVFTYYIIVYFQGRYGTHAELIEYINGNFKSRSAPGITYVTLEPAYRAANRFTHVWIICCTFGTLHWAFAPILTGTRALPLHSWYPFNALSPQYEIIYICQVLGQVLVGIGYGNVGAMLMSKITLVNGQYDMLFCSLKNLQSTAMILRGNHKEQLKNLQRKIDRSRDEINEYYVSCEILENLPQISDTVTANIPSHTVRERDTYFMEYNNELVTALKECIKHHQMIIKFCHMLEHFYHFYNLGKFFQITFLVCLLAVTATTGQNSAMKMVTIAEYLSLATSELLLFCYYADMLTYQSTRLNEAIIRSPWYTCGGPIRRDLIIMLANSVKPFTLTAGKFFLLTVESFKSAMAASFSYYTLLTKFRTRGDA
ncbi:odorant receptor 83a [Phlebotomus argentipes]|uniref:odorant receptor 83a n=1 Tax=Phlebotomus argentipes TaxID=94469 RepID=UPI002892EBE0|nr:odorant receptor 83a [Phlebotomus argentipes]